MLILSSFIPIFVFFFFFNDPATTEIYTLSLHDALPICTRRAHGPASRGPARDGRPPRGRSEEHTSELQSRRDLVCRLLLEKKKTTKNSHPNMPHFLSTIHTPCTQLQLSFHIYTISSVLH